jgi:hypothetical protein
VEKQAMQGIIMQGPSVLATLAGNKTQTRRISKYQPGAMGEKLESLGVVSPEIAFGSKVLWFSKSLICSKIPHPVGSVRYVKEAYWARKPVPYGEWELYYKADTPLEIQNELKTVSHNINNALFMPERFSRCHIKITGVRVEQMQDISDEDVVLEGCLTVNYPKKNPIGRTFSMDGLNWFDTPKEAYRDYFIKINGVKVWKSNPWVFVYDYEVVWSRQ